MLAKKVLTLGGLRIAYRRWGDPQAPAVVLLMGLSMSMDAWPQTLIDGLVQEGFQVVTPDNRDSGDSSHMTEWRVSRGEVLWSIGRFLLRRRVAGEYALEDMALDVERLLDALGIRRAHIVGISLGGMIAQTFAFHCPNRAATLTSMSSAVGNPRTGLGSFRSIAAVLKTDGEGGPEAARKHVERVLAALSGPRYKPTPAEVKAALERAADIGRDSGAVMRQVMAILASGDRSDQVRQIRVPTLVIHGTGDPLLPLAAGEETARLIAGSQFLPVEGLGHTVPLALVPFYVRAIASICHAHPA